MFDRWIKRSNSSVRDSSIYIQTPVEEFDKSDFLIDGEAVVCGTDGVSDFNKLHSREHDDHVFLYAFDLLSVDGIDLRHERLDDRRAKLKPLLARQGFR